jgi:prolyl-tRNA synthetase
MNKAAPKKPRTAITPTRGEDFSEWYQAVIQGADLAETSPVRGCMVIKPWGYGIWELIQRRLDDRIRETGHENCYFPLFIPLSFIAREAEHVEGFAKEMAVVTHHRLISSDGKLIPDPSARLEEPLVVRPTSETIIGDAFRRWTHSYRDLPILINQWANVVRWEMRTRLFLRTAEFLWQEGHTAHANREEAEAETMKMLEVYRTFAMDVLAMPVVAGEKPDNERFPGAENTYSIEAMMQDGKALQAGTSHYLGEHFARAQNIQYQNAEGGMTYAHTTSWGVSTRLIGGVIMTHGDDDGLRVPPRIAPYQVVIVPLVRDGNEQEVFAYSDRLAKRLRAESGVRVLVDKKDVKPVEKRWTWVKRGAPIICEVGSREVAEGVVSQIRRDQLRDGGKVRSVKISADEFVKECFLVLDEIQGRLYAEARTRLETNIRTDINTFDELKEYFGQEKEEDGSFRGWARVPWRKPTKAKNGALLDDIDERLKALKLTIRNAPLGQDGPPGKACIFTGADAVEEVLIGRAY